MLVTKKNNLLSNVPFRVKGNDCTQSTADEPT